MNINEQRRKAAFEDFAKGRGHTNFRCWGEAHGCTGCNDYEDDAVSQLFELWNAALDSVVIELPKERGMVGFEEFCNVRDRCREAIESAGLKVMP